MKMQFDKHTEETRRLWSKLEPVIANAFEKLQEAYTEEGHKGVVIQLTWWIRRRSVKIHFNLEMRERVLALLDELQKEAEAAGFLPSLANDTDVDDDIDFSKRSEETNNLWPKLDPEARRIMEAHEEAFTKDGNEGVMFQLAWSIRNREIVIILNPDVSEAALAAMNVGFIVKE